MEILEAELDYKYNPLTIERISENILVEFDQMNEKSGPRTSIEEGKPPYIKSQYKDTCTTCGRYKHKGKYCWHKEGANVPTCYYCDKPGHVNTNFLKRTREEKSKKNKIEDNKNKYIY